MFKQSTHHKSSSLIREGRGRSTALFLIELLGTCAFFGSLYAIASIATVAIGNF
ncbi:MAG: hypothetical protein RJS97_05105 [Parvibaculaceae bacterium]